MFNVLQRWLGTDNPPNKVLEIKSESLGTLQVLARDDSMVLFAPQFNANDKKSYFEVVLQRPHTDPKTTSFSLFRSTSQKESEEMFNIFMHRLPIFVSIVKEFNNINGLQKLCDILIENPSWSLTHLVAYFNLVDYINHPKVLQFIDYAEHSNHVSPLQLAIKVGNIEMVKALLPLSDMDHLDINNNSVYHYGASTNTKILNILIERSKQHLNDFNSEGYTPLHLACLADKQECVNTLLIAGADVNPSAKIMNRVQKSTPPTSVAGFVKKNSSKLFSEDMKNGGTPLHWCSSRDTLNSLIMQGCDINAVNFNGRTALHVMVRHNRFDCVLTLLAHNADIDSVDKDGNTPLHLAIEKRLPGMVQCLAVFGCDINAKNGKGETPRHMVGGEATGSKDDEILHILHSVGAARCPESSVNCPSGCNAKGTYDGIPPETPESVEQREHIEDMLSSASRQNIGGFLTTTLNDSMNSYARESIGQVVIDTENEQKGQSIMDAILGMFISKSSDDLKQKSPVNGCESGASGDATNAKKPCTTYRGRVLCLDGGGIRGLVLLQMLHEIEQISETPIIHLFDWIAGTSTGGIVALGLGCGKTVRQCMGLYLCMKDQCFVGSRPYPSDKFESILKSNLGEFAVMTDIKHPKIMVTGVMADRRPVDLHLFRNYTCASDILGIVTPISNRRLPPPDPKNQLIWRAARATGAAPSYFRAFGQFLDGGLIANNPTLDAMTEIHEYNMALRSVGRESEAIPISVVVSLGTGLIPVTELKGIDIFRPESIWDTAKFAYVVSTMGNLLVDQATASDGRVVDRARAWCSTINVPYYRLNPQLCDDIAMDEKDDEKIVKMLWSTKVYMYNNRKKIMEMISYLK